MKYTKLLAIAILSLSSPLNADRLHTVSHGDTLLKLLKDEGFKGEYKDLLVQLDEIKTLNNDRFGGKSLDLIYPGEAIILPTVYVEPEPEPEPEPIPEPVVEPVAVAEPTPDYVGKAKLGRSQAELIRENESQVLANVVDLITQDKIKTDTLGRAAVELNDNSRYVVGPNSEFVIEDFRYSPSKTESFIAKLNLLVGAISVKTGKIGKKSKDVYEFKTPAATVGVRGTEYTVRYCAGDECGDLKGTTAAVKNGAITIDTPQGEVEVPKGKFVQVEAPGSSAIISDIPEGYFDLDRSATDVKLSWFQRIRRYIAELGS